MSTAPLPAAAPLPIPRPPPRAWRRMPLGLALALAGLVSVRLAAAPLAPDVAAAVDRLFAKWDRPDSAGVIVGVARDGETLHARGYGQANLEHGIPLGPATISESGSVAKQFTAAAVVLLAVRGQLGLDDPVRRHLPELPAELADGISVRMLLNHTSGLRDIHGLFDLMGRPSYTSTHDNDEVLRVMSRQRRLNFPPGTEYLYCNASYALVPAIVARVSGRPFAAFCAQEIFGPRGLAQTRWRDHFTAVIPGRATGYAPRAGGGWEIDLAYSNLVGNGGLLTTVGDLLRWCASFDGAAGEWAEVVRQLQIPAQLKDGRTLNYGLGLMIDRPGGVLELSHSGSTAGYRTFLAHIPSRRFSVALLANAADFDGGGIARSIATTVLELPRAPRPPRGNAAAADVRPLAGVYHSAKTDGFLRLGQRDGRLLAGGVELVPTGPHTFATASGRTSYVFADGGRREVTVKSANGDDTFTAVKEVRPDAAALGAYAGTYASAELDVSQRVSVRDGKLVSSRWPWPDVTAEPTFADGFWFGRGWHVTFTRDAAGRVDGFEATNAGGRCRRIRFERQ